GLWNLSVITLLLTRCAAATPITGAGYDALVLAQRPVLYLTMSEPRSGHEVDRSGHGHDGSYDPHGRSTATVAMPNGERAADSNGNGQYLLVPTAAALSVPATGMLTLEAWIRPEALQFSREEGSGYVYWIGKGRAHAQEYALRMYSTVNTE